MGSREREEGKSDKNEEGKDDKKGTKERDEREEERWFLILGRRKGKEGKRRNGEIN